MAKLILCIAFISFSTQSYGSPQSEAVQKTTAKEQAKTLTPKITKGTKDINICSLNPSLCE